MVLRIHGTSTIHSLLFATAPDAAPALQLTITGTANLAAAQREAAASNSSYEIVRLAPPQRTPLLLMHRFVRRRW